MRYMNSAIGTRQVTSRVAASAALLITLLSACQGDRLLSVETPDIVTLGNVNTIQGAEALYAGALGDLAVAKDGGAGTAPYFGGMGVAEAGGWLADEFRWSGTQPLVGEMDLRNVDESNTTWSTTYLNLHRARASAERAASVYASVLPSGTPKIGELWAIAALSEILLGEAYCAGVPLSSTTPSISYGKPLTTQELFQHALTRLDSASKYAAGNANITNLVAVLRGRALLNLGSYNTAAAAVAAVPTGYEYLTQHSATTPRESNLMYSDMFLVETLSVSDLEGGTGLNFASAGDPRVPVTTSPNNGGLSSFDGVTPQVRFERYNSYSAPVVTASGVEARLIEAEAAANAGSGGGVLASLNAARANAGVSGLAPLTADPGTLAARIDLVMRERGFWMFATGHRLGDLRRLIRQYGRAENTVFPSGPYHKGNFTYGNDVNIVIPLSERNNPNYSGCLDRKA